VTSASIAFIGAGNMAQSLISGMLASGVPADQLAAADPAAQQRAVIAAKGVHTAEQGNALLNDATVVVLAVKPQVIDAVVSELDLTEQHLLISIAAGVDMAAMSRLTSANQPIVRCMPNTPALLQQGITGLCANGAVTQTQRAQAQQILSAAGEVIWFDNEIDLDAVTAVSGSGPAYFFYLMEAMVAAGEALGLDTATATKLTLATATGAAAMAQHGASNGQTPAQLRTNVTSPGGTTERALAILDQHQASQQIQNAVHGAAQRAAEMARDMANQR